MSEYIYDDEGPVFMRLREEITRCRDCKHFVDESEYGVGLCTLHNDTDWYTCEPDGFCAWGERRGDD